MSDEIETLLDSYHLACLQDMAVAAGLNIIAPNGKKLNKEALVAKMRAEFFTRARVLASLARLNQRERAVLDRLLLRGGTGSTQSLEREAVRAGLATAGVNAKSGPARRRYFGSYVEGYQGNPSRAQSAVFADVVARLTYHGLVFSSTSQVTSGGTPYKLRFAPAATVYVPQAVRQYLPDPAPLPAGIPDWQPERVQAGEPELLLRNLYLYWDFTRSNTVTLIQSGLVGKRWLKAINNVLLLPDPGVAEARNETEASQIHLLRLLLQGLKLLQVKDGQLLPLGDDPLDVPPFWSWPPEKQVGALLELWPKLDALQELGGIASSYLPRYTHARQALLHVLGKLPTGSWIELDDLLDRLLARDQDFLFYEHSRIQNYHGSWYYSTGSGGAYFSGQPTSLLQGMERLENEFVRRCLSGLLNQLGVVELGYQGDAWSAFRITPAGHATLVPSSSSGVERASHENGAGKIVVQPSFQVIAMGPVSLALLARLDTFADRERADVGAFEYRLSRESVYRAQQAGMEVADIVRFFEQSSDVALPQNVRRSLDEWAAGHERIVFRSGVSLLHAAGPDLLARLAEDPQVGQLLDRAATPEIVLIKQGKQPELVSALLQQGLFPTVSGAQPESADHSVFVQKDGTLRLIHAVPNLYVRGRLERLAEETSAGEWRLSPAALARGGGSKAKALRILDELSRLHRGELPKAVVEQVKAWAGYYGTAAAETLTLVEFRDLETLNELSRLPELKKYLTPFAAGTRALAVVQAGDLGRVQEILVRFGVRFAGRLRR